MRHRDFIVAVCLLAIAALAAGCDDADDLDDSFDPGGDAGEDSVFIDWANLANPVLAVEDRMLKDPCVVLRDGAFFLFSSTRFSADDPDAGSKLPSFYRSSDLVEWEPFFDDDLIAGGSAQVDSPDVVEHDGIYYMVFQRDDPVRGERGRRLYYSTSFDLLDWTPAHELAPGMNPRQRHADGAFGLWGGLFYLGFKQGQTFFVTRSQTTSVTGEWLAPLRARPGEPLGWAENYQFLRIDGAWRMIATARAPGDGPFEGGYTGSHEPYIYTMPGEGYLLEDWALWIDKRRLEVPAEDWNQVMHANSAYLADWRAQDGYFYLFYAGANDDESFDGRGHGTIGVARSVDLTDWRLPGNAGD